MSGASILHRRQNRIIGRCQEAGAIDPGSARTLGELEIHRGVPLWSLTARSVLRRAGEDEPARYWLDQAEADRFLRQRRKRVIVEAAIGAAVMVVIVMILL